MKEEIDAGAEFTREFSHWAPVKAAFWLKAADAGQRYLYVTSDKINETNTHLAYGEVLRVTAMMQSIYLDPFQVKVLNADKPLAQAAIALNESFPNRQGNRVAHRMFGGIFIDQAYIYPSPIATLTI